MGITSRYLFKNIIFLLMDQWPFVCSRWLSPARIHLRLSKELAKILIAKKTLLKIFRIVDHFMFVKSVTNSGQVHKFQKVTHRDKSVLEINVLPVQTHGVSSKNLFIMIPGELFGYPILDILEDLSCLHIW